MSNEQFSKIVTRRFITLIITIIIIKTATFPGLMHRHFVDYGLSYGFTSTLAINTQFNKQQ